MIVTEKMQRQFILKSTGLKAKIDVKKEDLRAFKAAHSQLLKRKREIKKEQEEEA